MVNANRGLEPVVSAAVRRLSHLRGVLATRVFHRIEDFSGVTEPQLMMFTGEKADRIAAALDQLMKGTLLDRCPVYRLPNGELTSDAEKAKRAEESGKGPGHVPVPIFHMHYLSDEGTIIVEHRDMSSLARVRTRVHEDIRKDHADERPQFLHTLQMNDCFAALASMGYDICAGYRACLYLPGGRQLVPDAYMGAELDLGEHVVEEVRGNPTTPEFRGQVRKLLQKYVTDARTLGQLQVIYVCESERVRSIVREEADEVRRAYQVDLDAVAVLDAAVRVGPAREGRPEVWRPLYMPVDWNVEYERSAVERSEIREKLMPFVRVKQAGHSCSAIFICETQVAAVRFEEEHQKLQRAHNVQFLLVTSTHERVTTQAGRGMPWSMNGQPVRLI